MTEQEFIANIKNVTKQRKHVIKNSLGTQDFILTYKHPTLSQSMIRQIIKLINLELSNELAQGQYIKFPKQMGGLELRQTDSYVKFQDGKLKTNRMVDWNSTLKLWYADVEAKLKKQLVRLENKKIFSVFYNKGLAKYNNKLFYEFIPNRSLKQKIKQNIQTVIISDTFKHD